MGRKEHPVALMEKLVHSEDIRYDTYEAIADITGEQRLKKIIQKRKGRKSVCARLLIF